MDAYETETERVEQWRKGAAAADEIRPPLGPSEKQNAAAAAAAGRKLRTREITSRYKSPLKPMRLSSNITSTNATTTTSSSVPKRAQSAERRRPTTPPSSPSRPSTPVSDSPIRSLGGRTIEGLWPSTRSLSVSFQVDAFSIPVTKRERPISPVRRERPVTPVSSVQTLRNSGNVAQRQNETQLRKASPERKRTPLRGRNNSDLSENSRPVENAHAKVFDQHRWPSRTGGRLFANSTRSVDLSDNGTKATSLPTQGRRAVLSDSRRYHKSVTEEATQVDPDGSRRFDYETGSTRSADDAPLRIHGIPKFISSSPRSSLTPLEITPPFIARPSRTRSLPIQASHHPSSPKLSPASSSSSSKGIVSPFRPRPSSPSFSRPSSPSRTRPSTPFSSASSVTSRSSSSSSVLSFITDVRKGKKSANQIEDVHRLRLLHNRYLQWRFVNARADVALSIQEMTSENILYNVWSTTSELCDSVSIKRINLQQMRQEMKLNSILKEQMTYLEDWASAEREHSSSLSGAIQALEASTVRLPVTIGAMADIRTVKEAISSAVDIMQAMGSSICSLLPRVEETNHLVSQLACVAAQERAMLDECGDLLASTAALQVEESSLRTHLIQMKQPMHTVEVPVFASIQAFV